MTIGAKIRKLRKERNLTQAQLGERAGVEIHSVTRYESGRVRPRAKLLQRFADALGVTVEELQADEPAPSLGIKDPELLDQFRQVDQLNESDKTALKRIIQAVIIKNQVQDLTRSA